METNPSTLQQSSGHTTAKDFFLHLGAMAGLYAAAISFITLFFRVIDKAYPAITTYYYGYSPSISLPVATLIIVFPIYILLFWLNEKSYAVDITKKQIAIRRWLTYITLFVAGIILVGDLVTILYKFLDGQDLTTAFVLKALVVILVTGGVFGFYIQDIREKLSTSGKKIWAIISLLIVLASIILGFSVIGSPMTQRLIKYDNQRVSDLQSIQWQVVNYWQKGGTVPESLQTINDPISGFVIPKDPQTQEVYKYTKTSNMTFRLCATFGTDSQSNQSYMSKPVGMGMDENWSHSMGEKCFDRTIDPTLYPVIKPIR